MSGLCVAITPGGSVCGQPAIASRHLCAGLLCIDLCQRLNHHPYQEEEPMPEAPGLVRVRVLAIASDGQPGSAERRYVRVAWPNTEPSPQVGAEMVMGPDGAVVATMFAHERSREAVVKAAVALLGLWERNGYTPSAPEAQELDAAVRACQKEVR